MSFIGDLFGVPAGDAFNAAPTTTGKLTKPGADSPFSEPKPTVIDNPPQKPAKPPIDKVGSNAGNLGGTNSLLGGGIAPTG